MFWLRYSDAQNIINNYYNRFTNPSTTNFFCSVPQSPPFAGRGGDQGTIAEAVVLQILSLFFQNHENPLIM